jgi:uncharacterized membrane protein
MISATRLGILIGATLALAWVAFGFWAGVLVAVGMVVGGLIGRIVDGRPDVREIVAALRGRRTMS